MNKKVTVQKSVRISTKYLSSEQVKMLPQLFKEFIKGLDLALVSRPFKPFNIRFETIDNDLCTVITLLADVDEDDLKRLDK